LFFDKLGYQPYNKGLLDKEIENTLSSHRESEDVKHVNEVLSGIKPPFRENVVSEKLSRP
jgi:hypothetical protein